MAYQQLVTPNLSPVIIQKGRVLTDWFEWCLAYVQSAYNSGWAGDTAWDAWSNHLTFKHQDRNIPAGVYVPIWFSGYGGDGHAAIYKDNVIYSSPLSHKAMRDVILTIEDMERKYGVTFVGWSEDLGGIKVIEEGEDMAVIEQQRQQINDMQAQIDILRPDLVNANSTIDALHQELDAERRGYTLQIAALQEQLKTPSIVVAPAPVAEPTVAVIPPTSPVATLPQTNWFVRFLAAIVPKKKS